MKLVGLRSGPKVNWQIKKAVYRLLTYQSQDVLSWEKKGIGRLAIASIGSQVLIVSKAKLRSKEYDIVVAFINWEIFELPGINLEDIVIPVREYSHMPNAADIDSIKNEVIQSLDKLNQKELIDDKDFEKIKKFYHVF